jgi:hypothetical protein
MADAPIIYFKGITPLTVNPGTSGSDVPISPTNPNPSIQPAPVIPVPPPYIEQLPTASSVDPTDIIQIVQQVINKQS